MDKNSNGEILNQALAQTPQRYLYLTIGFICVLIILALLIFMREQNMHNHINNKRTSVHAFEWATAIHNGGTNDYGYNISREQQFALQSIIGKDKRLSEFRSILPFKVESHLSPRDGNGKEFTVRINNESVENSIYYYDFTLAYCIYSTYGKTTSNSNNYYFTVKITDGN